jgi:non-specific serine/threonine protein kinase
MNAIVTFRGGRIRVDLHARVVLVDGRQAKLGGRAFDLLAVLMQGRDRVVPKQELLDVVWPGLFVEENNLQVHVLTLRKLLGPESIVTVTGRGYQFALTQDTAADADSAARLAASPPPAMEALPGRTLIGRDVLIASTSELFRRDDVHLVTLSGTGGSGKTRVALRVAADLAHEFADGSYVVMLAPVRDAAHVPAAIASVLGVQESSGRSIDDLVLNHLRERSLVLTLDNFEHVIDASAFIAKLIEACPRLKVLVTSRVLLRLGAEREVHVPPLPVPAARAGTAQTMDTPAVRLFVELARSIGYPIGEQQSGIDAVADICRRLDGLPLALELAAGRLRMLTPGQLAQRLGSSLAVLKSTGRDVPDRHRTLRGAIAWSFDLLDAAEQTLFRRLAVFSGGWTLDAAESIAGGTGLRGDVLDALSALVDNNLVQRIDEVDGEARFTMLETVREFAAEQFDPSGEADDVRASHAQYFLALAERLDPRLRGGNRAPWLARLKAEYNNIRAALSLLVVDRPDIPAALRLCGALAWFWYFTAQFSEGRRVTGQALALPGAEAPTVARATALSGAARLAFYAGALDEAIVLGSESVALLRSLDDRRGLGYALFHLALPNTLAQDKADAFALLAEAAQCFRDADDEWGIALAMSYRGAVLSVVPDREDEASIVLTKARARARALGDSWLSMPCSHYLGSIALRRGDLQTARSLTEETLIGLRELGEAYRVSRMLHQLAEIALASQNPDEALSNLQESLAITHDQRRTGDLALQLRLLASIKAAQSELEEAVRFAAAASRLEGHPTTMPPDDRASHEQLRDRLRATLGDARYETEWELGAAMSIAQTVESALTAA